MSGPVSIACAAVFLLQSAVALAAPARLALEQVTLLAAGQSDSRVVLQLPDKSLVELRVGEQLAGTEARLSRVTAGLAVFEDQAGSRGRQTVWLHLHGRAERLRPIPDPAPAVRPAPQVARVPVTPPAAPAR